MARVTACDGCGTTQGQFGKVVLDHVDLRDGYSVHSLLIDLCVGCLTQELQGVIKDNLDTGQTQKWVEKFHRLK